MQLNLVSKLAIALGLLAAGQGVAADNGSDEPLRVLVTYDNAAAHASGLNLMPGRSYRYRSRYKISPAARRNAKAIAADYQLEALDDWPIESLHIYCVVYKAAEESSLAQLVNRLQSDPRVESAQPMQRFETMSLTAGGYNDAYVEFQHGLKSMNVSQAHQYANGSGVKIAVVDTGVDVAHEDLESGIQTREFVDGERGPASTAHGTAVVSLIAANSNNAKGIVGVAPEAELVALSACWAAGLTEAASCNSFTLAKAMDFLVRSPPALVNLSIAGPYDALLGRLIAKAQQNGTVIVAALPELAANGVAYPANYPGVLAVGAAQAAASENNGRALLRDELSAPGDQIMVALPDNRYDFRSGSSLAAAHATGIIALLLELAPDLTSADIEKILRKSQLGNQTGNPIINACRALAQIDVTASCP